MTQMASPLISCDDDITWHIRYHGVLWR